jgi:hypothetical protein
MIKVNLKEFVEREKELMVIENWSVEDINYFDELLSEEMGYKEFLINFGEYWKMIGEFGGDSEVIFDILKDNINNKDLSLEEGCKVWLEYWYDENEEDREERKEIFVKLIEE